MVPSRPPGGGEMTLRTCEPMGYPRDFVEAKTSDQFAFRGRTPDSGAAANIALS